MNLNSLTSKIAAGLLALSAGYASAADYYVVTPVKGKTENVSAISVALNSFTLPGAIINNPYSGFDFKSVLQVTGDSNLNLNYASWSLVAGALPTGMTLGADGKLSGTPTAAGTSSFSVKVTYKTKTGEQSYQIVVANITVSLASGTPPQALTGSAYSYNLNSLLSVANDPAFDGSGVTWSVVSSSLPAGLYLTTDGYIGGTPTAAGSGTITARATYRGVSGEQTYSVVSLNITVGLSSATLPSAFVGVPYDGFDFKTKLSVSGDPAYTSSAVTWSVASGTLPAGLTLNSNGTLSGTPTTSGTSNFTIRADYRNKYGQLAYQVITSSITVTLNTATLSSALVGSAYNYDFKTLLSVTGDASYTASQATWSVVSGSLPAGLTLNNATGVVSGTPTAAGSSPFTLQASYKTKTGQQAYTLVAVTATSTYNMVNEGSTLSLTAPAGTVFREVVFASYGTPTGTGPNYVQGTCHAATSSTQVSTAFLNKSTASIGANNTTFGDPCNGTPKRLAVVLRAY